MLLFALILAVASPVAKYVINNKGEQILGRQMHADLVIINPYWGGVTIKGFECKEPNGETNFVSFDRLYVQIAYPHLLAKHVTLRAIHLDGFNGQVLKNDDKVNFSDIIERFSKKDTTLAEVEKVDTDTTKSSWKVHLKDIRINRSAIRYRDVESGKQWKLEDLSLRVPGLYFDNTQTNAGIEFGLPTGGRVGIVAGMKMKANRYAVRLNLYDVHTDVVLPLVQDYLDVTGLGAKINGSVHVDGSLEEISNILLNGHLTLSGLSLRDRDDEEIAAMQSMRIVFDKGDVATNTYLLDTLVIDGITGSYEVHENWNTLSKLVKKPEEKKAERQEAKEDSVETAEPQAAKAAPKPLVWMAKNVVLTGHDLNYRDYSMNNEWGYAIKTLNVKGKNVASNGRNQVDLKATLTSGAQVKADYVGSLNLKKDDCRLNLKMTGVQLSDFGALCQNYTGYPLDGGVLALESHVTVEKAQLQGTNLIIIDRPRVGKKEMFSKAPYKNIPLRAAFGVLTSAQDKIVLDVPVKGDVSNPKFKLGKVIGRALLKVFFGPLMGVNDGSRTISDDEAEEMQELLGEDSVSLSQDTVGELAADVAMPTSDSVGLSEVSQQ